MVNFSILKGLKSTRYLVLCAVFSTFLIGCNSDSAPDCLQNTGDLVRKQVEVSAFTKIIVFEKVAMVLKQGDVQKVEVETGEYLWNDIVVSVDGNQLVLKNNNSCNYFREYGVTTVYITSPNITEIRSSTGETISSDGVLAYDNVNLLSESYSVPEAETTVGAFDLKLQTENVSIVTNGKAYFKIDGITENLSVQIAAGDSRIDASLLKAQKVSFNHRGSNDLLVNPIIELTGVIRGYGDVISYYTPDIVEVDEIFKGQLLYAN